MKIRGRTKGRVVVLDLCGRIDEDSANFIETVGRCLRDGYRDILCNLEAVDFIDYMGISVIVIACKEAINSKARMKFVNIPTHLRDLFSITGLDKTIDIYVREDIALNSFKEDRKIESIRKLRLRRRFKRLPIGIKAELKDKYAKKPDSLKVDILDLGAQGAYVYGCSKFKLNDVVILKFKVPPKLQKIQLDVRVVWLSDKQIQQHIHPGMGIEFYNISTSTQKRLLDFVERNLSHI
ncbi:PilZ domain-containing protein [bacterium]|nr:PilZ domain-containing protein [bacterium]